jgi:hypothetical protein
MFMNASCAFVFTTSMRVPVFGTVTPIQVNGVEYSRRSSNPGCAASDGKSTIVFEVERIGHGDGGGRIL